MKGRVLAAFAMGALLPILETCRRGLGHWRVDASTMLEDYIAGGLLILAAVLAMKGKRLGDLLLIVAWSYATGMMTGSLLNQVEETVRGTDTEPHNAVVVVVKLVLWSVCLFGAISSIMAELRRSS